MARFLGYFLATLMLAAPVRGEVPRVVTDIAPVHSLVAMVMGDLGQPDLIVTPGMSPHGNALRPSQARTLQQADLVIWMGPGLSPWLRKPVATLGANAGWMVLPEMPGTHLLNYRQTDQDNQSGNGPDPHAWLDPENARIWLALIADRLAGFDPINADRYRANAIAGQAEIASLQSFLAAQLAPMRGISYVTFHDAYQYFENRFGLQPVGSVTTGDVTKPSPAKLSRLRKKLANDRVKCAFISPQSDPGLLHAVIGSDVKIIPLDPLGRALAPGPRFYPGLLRDMGIAFADCLGRN